jgi:hypothetical protein
MQFGPLELQSCGENNFTMKALGLLAFRPELRARFVRKLAGPDALSTADGDVSILFFNRIGECFFREAIERERTANPGEFEERLNAALDLPEGFRWRRNKDGRLTQPAKWQAPNLEDMLRENGIDADADLKQRLEYLQDILNTEPDIVLQWGRKLALVEIKVLSPEGMKQIDRQMNLGRLLCKLLGWEPPMFFFIGPDHGGRPASSDCRFISWAEVADWFSDVPEIEGYIRSFAFFYHGKWQSMVSAKANNPGTTAFDLMQLTSRREGTSAVPGMPTKDGQITQVPSGAESEAWHFSHLGRDYFLRIFDGCKDAGVWPLQWIWVGSTGVAFAEKAKGQKINPNWMIEDKQHNRRTRTSGFSVEGRYQENRMKRFSYDEIAKFYDLA